MGITAVLFVAMHPEEAASGRFCRYSVSIRKM